MWAVGSDGALRFAPDAGPLAAARDDSPESLAALAALVPAAGTLVLLQAEPVVLPESLVAVSIADGVQLVLDRLVPVASPVVLERLTEADIPAMVELATLTRPGPFARRTSSLGEFWGVKERGALIAMAGERMNQPGFTEVSGVCTHPDARGRGLARALSAAVAAAIVARGDTPYLHAYAANSPAIELYKSLGFRIRCPVHVAEIGRLAADATAYADCP
jgi:predicted GNAT family acetyltransferase